MIMRNKDVETLSKVKSTSKMLVNVNPKTLRRNRKMDKKIVERIPYEGMKNGTHLDVEVYYSKGGTSYLSGTVSPRGYYLSVTGITYACSNGCK